MKRGQTDILGLALDQAKKQKRQAESYFTGKLSERIREKLDVWIERLAITQTRVLLTLKNWQEFHQKMGYQRYYYALSLVGDKILVNAFFSHFARHISADQIDEDIRHAKLDMEKWTVKANDLRNKYERLYHNTDICLPENELPSYVSRHWSLKFPDYCFLYC